MAAEGCLKGAWAAPLASWGQGAVRHAGAQKRALEAALLAANHFHIGQL